MVYVGKIGEGRIGSGTIGNPAVSTTAVAAVTRILRQSEKRGITTVDPPAPAATPEIGSSTAIGYLGFTAAVTSRLGYESDLLDKNVSVGGLSGGVLLVKDFRLLARANRSWPSYPMLVDLTGHSRNAFSAIGAAWIGGGRLTLLGASTSLAQATGATGQSTGQPRIEAKAKLSFQDTTVLFSKWTGTAATSSYKLECINNQLKYSYSDGTTIRTATSDSLVAYGLANRSTIVVAVNHLINGSNTDISFQYSVDDGVTWTTFGPVQHPGSAVTVATTTTALKVGPGVGEIFWARVRNAVNLALVAELDAFDVPTRASQFGAGTDVWTITNPVGTDPELVQDENVEDWGLNLNADTVQYFDTLPIDVTLGGAVAVGISASHTPSTDVHYLVSTGSSAARFDVVHTTTGKVRVLMGDNVFESSANSVLGDCVVMINFDPDSIDVYLNKQPVTQQVVGPIPLQLNLTPARLGIGSADDTSVLLTGLAVLNHKLSVLELDRLDTLLRG